MLAFAVAIDVAVVQTTVSGLAGLLVLACLAFVLKPVEVVCWAVIYVIAFFCLLVFNSGQVIQWPTIFIRVTTLVVGSVVCVTSSVLRYRTLASRDELHRLLMSLPVPALVADGDGVIQICNDRMFALFTTSESEMLGVSFFSYFSDPDHRGKEIARYVGWIDRGVNEAETLTFALSTDPPIRMQGSVSVASLNQRKAVVVCLSDRPLDFAWTP